MDITAVLAFAAIALTLVVVPGPDWAYILAAGARDHVVIPAVGGLVLGYALITAIVVVGVGPLVAAIPAALTVLTLVGAGYLAYLGVRTLMSTGKIHADTKPLASSTIGYVWRGVGVSGLNPKGLLIFLSILPQFTNPAAAWPLPAQLATLGAVFMALTVVFYLPLGFAAHRVLGARPRVSLITTRVAGVAMILVGAALLIERILILLAH